MPLANLITKTSAVELRPDDFYKSIVATILEINPRTSDLPSKIVDGVILPYLQAVIDTAHHAGHSFSCVLRNRVAAADESSVEEWKLLLHVACQQSPVDASLVQAREYVGRPAGRAGLLLNWLEHPEQAAKGLGKIASTLELYFAVRESFLSDRKVQPIPFDRLRVPLSRCIAEEPEATVNLLVKLLSAGPGTKRLTMSAYQALPGQVRERLFRDPDGSRWLPQEVARRFRRNPYAYAATPQSIARREAMETGEALICAGQFAGDEVRAYLEHEKDAVRVREALKKAAVSPAIDSLDPALLAHIQKRFPSVEALAVRVRVSGPEAGATLLARRSLSVSIDVLNSLPNGFVNALLAVHPDGRRIDALISGSKVSGPELIGEFLKRQRGIPRALVADFWSFYSSYRRKEADIGSALKYVGQLSTTDRRVLFDGPAFKSWSNMSGKHEDAAVRMLADAWSGSSRATWEREVVCFIGNSPGRALVVIRRTGSVDLLDTLLRSKTGPALALALVKEPPDSAGSKKWTKWLKNRKRPDQIPREVAKRLSAEARQDDQVLQGLPSELAASVVWNWPRSVAVDRALKSPTVSHLLDQKLSEADRLRIAARLRKSQKSRPRVAAAYELAGLFGLSFLGPLLKWSSLLPARASLQQLGRSLDGEYRVYERPKQSGGKRLITVPSDTLKAFLGRVLVLGLNQCPLHPAAHGFSKGKSIVSNATPHCQQRIVVNVDIKSFFPSTPYRHVRRVVSGLYDRRISENGQRLLTEILCFNGGLPTGAPTSPAIANLVLRPVDRALDTVCQRKGIVYTRYADDLTFSGERDVTDVLPFARQVLAELGYELDDKKTNIFRAGRRQIVTGLVVNERPNMPRRLRRRLRAAVHHRLQGQDATWHGKVVSEHQLMGYLAFLGMTQPVEAARLREVLRTTMKEAT